MFSSVFKKSKKDAAQVAIDFVAIENDFLLSCESKKLKLSRSIGNEFEKRIKSSEKGQIKSKLDFSGCLLTSDHFMFFLDTLRKHAVIAKVKVDNNNLTDVSMDYLIDFLKEQIEKASTVMIDNRLSTTFLCNITLEKNDVTQKKKSIALQLCDICSHYNARVVIRNTFWSIGSPEVLSFEEVKAMWDTVVKGHFDCNDKSYSAFKGKSSAGYLQVERAVVAALLEKKKLVDVNTPHHLRWFDPISLDSVPDTESSSQGKSKAGALDKKSGSAVSDDASTAAAVRTSDAFADGNTVSHAFDGAHHSGSQIIGEPFSNFYEEDSKEHNAQSHPVSSSGGDLLPRSTSNTNRSQIRSSTDILADHPAFNMPHVTRESHANEAHKADVLVSRPQQQQQKDNAAATFDFSAFNNGHSNNHNHNNNNNNNVSFSGSAISNIVKDEDEHQHSFNAKEAEKKLTRTKVLKGAVVMKGSAILTLSDYIDGNEFKLVSTLILSSNALTQENLTLPSEYAFSDVFHGFKNLLELNLSSNSLSGKLGEGLFPSSLTSLDLSNNKIVDVSSLITNFELKTLNVSNNLIKSIKVLPSYIEKLDLSNNVINSVISVRMLNLCQKLRNLNLSGNPIHPSPGHESKDTTIPAAARRSDKDWRVFIFSILPHLSELDGFVRMGVRLETKKKPTPREATYAAQSPESKPKVKLTRKEQEEAAIKLQNTKKRHFFTVTERVELGLGLVDGTTIKERRAVSAQHTPLPVPVPVPDNVLPSDVADPNPFHCKVVKRSAREIGEIITRLAAPKNESAAPVRRSRRRSLSNTSRSSRGSRSTSAEPSRRRNNIYSNFNDRSSSVFGDYEPAGDAARVGKNRGVVDAVELINAWLIKSSHEVGRAVAVLRLAAKMTDMRVVDEKSTENYFTAYEHIAFYREVEMSSKLEGAIISLPADGEYDALVKSTSETLENMTALASILKSISAEIKSRRADHAVLTGSDLGVALTKVMATKWGRYVASNVLTTFGFNMVINTTPAPPAASSLDLSTSSSGNRNNIFKDSDSRRAATVSSTTSTSYGLSGSGSGVSSGREQNMTQSEVAERLDNVKLRMQRGAVSNLTVETDLDGAKADSSPASVAAPLTLAAAAVPSAKPPSPLPVASASAAATVPSAKPPSPLPVASASAAAAVPSAKPPSPLPVASASAAAAVPSAKPPSPLPVASASAAAAVPSANKPPSPLPVASASAAAPAVVSSSNGFDGFSSTGFSTDFSTGFDSFNTAAFGGADDPFAAFSAAGAGGGSQGKPDLPKVELNISLGGFDMNDVSFDRLSDDNIKDAFSNFPIIDSDSGNIGPPTVCSPPASASASTPLLTAEDKPSPRHDVTLVSNIGLSTSKAVNVNLTDINNFNNEAQGYLTNVSDKIVVSSKSSDVSSSVPLSDTKLKEVITDVIRSSPMKSIATDDINDLLSHPGIVRQPSPVEAPVPVVAEPAAAPASRVSKEAQIRQLEAKIEALKAKDTKDMAARERIEWRVQLKKYEEEIRVHKTEMIER